MSEEIVGWRTSQAHTQGRPQLHTERDCTVFPADPIPVTAEQATHYEECALCAGTAAEADDGDWSYYNALSEAGHDV